MILREKNWWFVSLDVEKNHQSWETVLATNLCLRQKNTKTPTKMKILDKKNINLNFLEYTERHVLRL